MARTSPLMDFLVDRTHAQRFSGEDWCLMFSEARQAGLLCRLSMAIAQSPALNEKLPERLRKHVLAASVEAAAFQVDVKRELSCIRQALSGLDARVLLLKGASYVLLDLPAASGRIFSDIDVLVPKPSVASAEASLMLGGWLTGSLDNYDQRYYREWSHEVPPMTHMRRGTTIDLHHSLVMPTCRVQVDSDSMIGESSPVDENGFWWRLKDEDILLHAASHLMLNSEFDRGLRDLWDIDLLYRHFSSCSVLFADRLLDRSAEVGLKEIVRMALSLAKRFFGTPVPELLLPERQNLFVNLVARASSPRHPDTRPSLQGLADMLLLFREMYLRLPNGLLAIHVAHKISELFRQSEVKAEV